MPANMEVSRKNFASTAKSKQAARDSIFRSNWQKGMKELYDSYVYE